MANFLAQLVQSGALKQHDPMEAYGNALKMKTLQSLSQNATVDREAKLLEIGKGYLQRVKGPEDYGKYRDYMTKLGMNGDLLPAPESFKDEDDFANWQMSAIATAGELLKYRQGKPITVSKVNEDGTTSTLEDMDRNQIANLQKLGLLEGYRLGKTTGTPWKPAERIKEEAQATAEGSDAVEGKYKETPGVKREADLVKTKELETFKSGQQKSLEQFKSGLETGGSKKADTLRKEFTTQSKSFVDVRDSYSRIVAGAKEPSAAGDIALIFNYMKMLDPESVVRESEYATAANAAGIPDKIRAKYNSILRGERLAPETRKDFVGRAQMLFKEQRTSHEKLRTEYSRLAQQSGVDPTNVIVDYDVQEKRGSDPYEVGSVYEDAKGKRKKYLGDDKWEDAK